MANLASLYFWATVRLFFANGIYLGSSLDPATYRRMDHRWPKRFRLPR